MKKILVLIALMIISMATSAFATTTLLNEDFDDGNYDGWTVIGASSDVGVATSTGGQTSTDPYFWAQNDAGIYKTIDATQCTSDAQISVYVRTIYVGVYDMAKVETKIGADSWVLQVSHNGITWTQYTPTVTGSAGNTFDLKLWLDDGADDFGRFDDIVVTCETGGQIDNIPEFTTIGAGIALLGAAGYAVYRRKRK